MAASTPWWAVYTVASAGAGEAVAHYVQQATQPKITGNVEWVLGPYATKAQAEGAAATGNTGPGKFHGTGGLTQSGLLGSLPGLVTSSNLWERVLLTGLGVILVAVGVAKLTGALPVATKIAEAVK